jgi:hypothetical protein
LTAVGHFSSDSVPTLCRLSPKSDRKAAQIDLFDYVVRDGEQRRRHIDVERPRPIDLQVDHQLEFVRSLNREVGGLGALENASKILDAYLAKETNRARAI